MQPATPTATPKMTPVKSSNLAAVGHHDGHLYIEFHPGKSGISAVWRYLNVPVDLHQALTTTDSPGRLFQSAIKGAFTAERVR